MNKIDKTIPNLDKIEKSVILSSHIRMTIMLLLEQHNKLVISELQKLMNETPGNIDYHIKKLEQEGFVNRKPGFFNKRVLNAIEITSKGQKEIKQDIIDLRNFLDNFETKEGKNDE